jgi:hypothetical protein
VSIELILISISIFGILLLLLVRNFKLFYAKDSSTFLGSVDRFLSRNIKTIKQTYLFLVKNISEFIKDIPHLFLDLINKVLYRSHKKTKKLVDVIRGNRIKSDRGSVSLYLKRIESGEEE